jgi:anti-sigma28 factor (negative regulator of flagellin synthesis)
MMEINRLAGEIAGTGRAQEPVKSDGARKQDKISLCVGSSLLSLGVKFPESKDAVTARTEKVEALKAAVAAGTYNPDPMLVAAKVLGVE